MKKTGRNYVLKKNKSRRPFPKTRKHKNSKVKRTLKGGNPLLGPILAGVAALGIVGTLGFILNAPDETNDDMFKGLASLRDKKGHQDGNDSYKGYIRFN
jgi:hypothetical protein